MTFDEIDRALAGWNAQLATVADNLLELQADATYQLLTGFGGVPKLQLVGETAARVLPALASAETIFQHFGLLKDVLARAAALRRDVRPMFGREQTLREIQALLEGESIELPVAALPLAQRTLLSGAMGTHRLRPGDLLQGMGDAFAAARDAVLLVSRGWDELAVELEAAETVVRTLPAGSSGAHELQTAETLLAEVKKQGEGDPFAALERLRTQARPALGEMVRRVQLRAELRRQFAAAHTLIARVRGLREEAATAAASNQGRIAGWQMPPDDGAEEQWKTLQEWLERLEQRRDEQPASLTIGIGNWHKSAEACAAHAQERLRLARFPLETRRELRGRLDALKAKARAYGLAEDAAFAALAASAETLLYTRPVDLARAAAALEAYERKLSGLTLLKRLDTDAREERR